MTTARVRVEDLVVEFRARRRIIPAVRGVGFELAAGETLGLVGESGSGKSTVGRAIAGLVAVRSGRILVDGQDVTGHGPRRRRADGTDIQIVFQDPFGSLNPAMMIADILAEPLIALHRMPRSAAALRAQELLDRVHLPADAAARLPREFSGGQRQRIAIARAIALSPRVIVCDEPTSALDVSTRADVLDLLTEIQRETGVAYLFISHDLSVVRRMSDRIAVLRRGVIVEQGDAETISTDPSHPYTRSLLMAAPVADPIRQRERRERRRAALRAGDMP